jgi:hypothetical protein
VIDPAIVSNVRSTRAGLRASNTALNPAPRWPLGVTLALSLLVHAALGWTVSEVMRAPSLGIEFQLPMDVEFGTTDEMAWAPSAAAPQAPPAPSQAGSPQPFDPTGTTEHEPKPKPKRERAPAPAKAAGAAGDSAPHGPNADATRLPAGAQIAVRVDMARIRRSPLADDIRGLLAAIPDWRALLDGSGIDPVDQLDRFMIATPNLQRAKIIVAGRYVGSEQTVLEAVERLAAVRGVEARWRDRAGVRVAPWANLDETPRIIALVGPAHFVISREEDLLRVLAVANARAVDARERGEDPKTANQLGHSQEQPAAEPPADALLSMEEQEGLSLEVEGAEQFVRRATRGVPRRLRLSARELPGPRLELRARLSFVDVDKARDAAAFWQQLRDTYAGNPLVAMLGLSEPLRDGSVATEQSDVSLRVELSVEQARLIVGYLRELVRPPQAPSVASPAPPAPAAP